MAMGSLAGVLAPTAGAAVYASYGLRGLAILTFGITFTLFLALSFCRCLSLNIVRRCEDREAGDEGRGHDSLEITSLIAREETVRD